MNEPLAPQGVHQEGQNPSLLPPIIQARPEGRPIFPVEQAYLHDIYSRVRGTYTRFLGEDFPPPLVNQIAVDKLPQVRLLEGGYIMPSRTLQLKTKESSSTTADMATELVQISAGVKSSEGTPIRLPRRLADIILISHELGHAVFENATAFPTVLTDQQYAFEQPNLYLILSEGFATFMGHQFVASLINNQPAREALGIQEQDIPYLQRYVIRREVALNTLRNRSGELTGTERTYSDGNDIFRHLFERAQQTGENPHTSLRAFLKQIDPMSERITAPVNPTDATYKDLVQQGVLSELTDS